MSRKNLYIEYICLNFQLTCIVLGLIKLTVVADTITWLGFVYVLLTGFHVKLSLKHLHRYFAVVI